MTKLNKTDSCESCKNAPAVIKRKNENDRRYNEYLCQNCADEIDEWNAVRQFIPSIMKLGEGSW